MATDTEATRGPGAPPTKAPKARAGGRTPAAHRSLTIGETILGGTPPLGHCTDSRPTHAGLSEKEAYLPAQRGPQRALRKRGRGGHRHSPSPHLSAPVSYRKEYIPASGALTLEAAARERVSMPVSGAQPWALGSRRTGTNGERVLNQLPAPGHSRETRSFWKEAH